jgi:hypothetical protein
MRAKLFVKREEAKLIKSKTNQRIIKRKIIIKKSIKTTIKKTNAERATYGTKQLEKIMKSYEKLTCLKSFKAKKRTRI